MQLPICTVVVLHSRRCAQSLQVDGLARGVGFAGFKAEELIRRILGSKVGFIPLSMIHSGCSVIITGMKYYCMSLS